MVIVLEIRRVTITDYNAKWIDIGISAFVDLKKPIKTRKTGLKS